MPASTPAEQAAFEAKIREEFPAYIYHLLHSEIPAEIKGGRYGFQVVQNQEIVEAIEGTAPEYQIIEQLDHTCSGGCVTPYVVTALELSEFLAEHCATARNLTPRTCGIYLGRLASKTKRVIQLPKTHGINKYRITFEVDGKPVSEHPVTVEVDRKRVLGVPLHITYEGTDAIVTIKEEHTGEILKGKAVCCRSFKKDSVKG